MIRLAITLASIAAALAATSIAHAQSCLEGRVIVESTAGHCCWPGQSWSVERARCSGPPTCPGRLVADGDQCIPPMALPSIASSIGAVPALEDAALEWDGSPDLRRAVRDPRIQQGTDDLLLAGGIIMLASGYLAQILFSVGEEALRTCNTFFPAFSNVGCGTWGYSFIPIAGGIVAGTTAPSNASRGFPAFGIFAGIPSAALQAFGIVLVIVAAVRPTETIVAGGMHDDDPDDDAEPGGEEEDDDLDLAIVPDATDDTIGLRLVGRF